MNAADRPPLDRLLEPDPDLIAVFWRDFLTPYEISGMDERAVRFLLRSIGVELFGDPLDGR